MKTLIPLKRGYSIEVAIDNYISIPNVIVLGNYSKSNYKATQIVSRGGIAPTVRENHGQVIGIIDDLEN